VLVLYASYLIAKKLAINNAEYNTIINKNSYQLTRKGALNFGEMAVLNFRLVQTKVDKLSVPVRKVVGVVHQARYSL
jgi:hypothetical protein